MRRIYESDALHRDDDDPFAPREEDHGTVPRAMRSLPGGALSNMLVPHWLRYRGVTVSVSTSERSYAAGAAVPISIEMRNRLPVPVTLPTRSPRLWVWDVDGLPEGSRVGTADPPADSGEFSFDRGERKRFTRHWQGTFRVSATEWEPADPGEYTIGAAINVQNPADRGLRDETTIRLE